MIKFLSAKSLSAYSGKTALLRVDLNITPGYFDNYRIDAILPTVNFLAKYRIKTILLSHRGRPQNKINISDVKKDNFFPDFQNAENKNLSLKPLVKIISKKINKRVIFLNNFNFLKIKEEVKKTKNLVFLLENLRFLKGEEENDLKFAKSLSLLGDFYVNDAFAVSHRENASTVGICNYLPSYAGFLMKKEIENLDKAMKNFKRPLVVIIGGAKIKDKLGVLNYFWDKADYFLLGGGPANTFLKAKGEKIGKSLADKEAIDKIRKYLKSEKIILPSDFKVWDSRILDIGRETVLQYQRIIQNSNTVIWNGPMGFFEKKGFEMGTFGIWKAVLENKKAKIIVVGGGETITSLQKFENNKPGFKINKNLFISTGGGAMLEYLSGKNLPGIKAISLN